MHGGKNKTEDCQIQIIINKISKPMKSCEQHSHNGQVKTMHAKKTKDVSNVNIVNEQDYDSISTVLQKIKIN